jgi:hypothetical protein
MLEVEGCQNHKRRGKRKSFLLLPLVQSRGRFLCGRPLARWCAPPCLFTFTLARKHSRRSKPPGHGCVLLLHGSCCPPDKSQLWGIFIDQSLEIPALL